jgi:hypothetical protein
MLPPAADDQDQRPTIRVTFLQHRSKSAGLLGTAEKSCSLDMRGKPFGH